MPIYSVHKLHIHQTFKYPGMADWLDPIRKKYYISGPSYTPIRDPMSNVQLDKVNREDFLISYR